MTETDPRVSTVFSDLQRILFFLMMFATMVKDVVNAIGKPSGMTTKSQYSARVSKSDQYSQATAADTQLTIKSGTSIQFGCDFRSQAAHRTTMRTTTQVMNTDMIKTKRNISFWSGVMPVLGSDVSFAMRPKMVLSPVATQMPKQLPLMQCVPCIPMLFVSR